MAYPSDSGVSYTTKVDNVTVVQASDVNNLQTEVSAIKTLIGIIGSAVSGTFYYLMSEITGTDKAVGKTATQTLTNKTLTSPTITGATATTSTINGVNLQTAGSATDFLGADGAYHASSSSNASSTVKGIVELATSAEITSGLATGGTGAALVVTPDQLAASTPTFNGSNITSIPNRIATTTTDVTVTTTTTETTLLTQSITGGTLSTANYIRAMFYITSMQTLTTADTCTFRIKYGATTLISPTFNGSGAAGQVWNGKLEVLLAASGTTGTQNAVAQWVFSPGSYIGNGNITGFSVSSTTQGTAAEDSTTAKTFAVTAQFSASSASNNITVALITVESIA